MDSNALTAEIRAAARQLGFDRVGVCPAVAPEGLARFGEWIERGYGGTMRYLSERAEAYAHPRHVLEGVRSIVVLSTNYRTADPRATLPGQGRVSRYAWNDDYHDVIHARLKQLVRTAGALAPDDRWRGVVDTAPLLEREVARLAGLGWIGKHTLLLNRQDGSWFFLAALLTTAALAGDAPFAADHCGTCTACLDACPTGAFPAPYVLDARRCISYLTIELREPIPADLRQGLGDWLFGCDVCQEVCPWNQRAPQSGEPGFEPATDLNPSDLIALLLLDEAAFRQRFRHSPLWRARRRGLLRNAAIVLGNQRPPEALDALIRGLADEEPLVRGACAWSLGRFADPRARQALADRQLTESDQSVREEITAALRGR